MTKKKKEKKQSAKLTGKWLLLIFGISFIVRLLYILDIQSSPLFSYLTMDPLFYHELGLKIAAGQWIAADIFYKAPLYSYLLGTIYLIFGESYLIPRLLQILLGSISTVFIAMIAVRFYSKKVAITSGIIAALYGPFIYFEGEILIPSLIIFLNLVAFLLLFKYEDKGKPKNLFFSAILIGLSTIARPNLLIFLPAILYWLYKICKQSKANYLKPILMFSLGVILMILPVTLHNYVAGDELVLFGNYGGLNFAIGNNSHSDGRTAVLPGTSPEFWQGYDDAVTIANEQSRKSLSAGQFSSYWYGQGLKYIISEPLDWLGLEFRKLVYLVSGYEISNNKHIYFFAKRSFITAPLLWDKLIAFPFGLILPLALVTILGLRRSFKGQFLLSAFVIIYSISILLFFVTGRFRVPIAPILIIWAAAGTWLLIDYFRQKNYSKFYKSASIFVVGLLIANAISFIPSLSPRLATDYEGHLYLGNAEYAVGNFLNAQNNFSTAVNQNPYSARALYSLAGSYSALGKDSLAVETYQRVIRADKNHANAKQKLVSLYKKNNRVNDLYNLVKLEFDKPNPTRWAMVEYALIHQMLSEYEQAAKIYEEAFKQNPSDYELLLLKGQAYLNANMLDKAEREFSRLLEYLPVSFEARGNLGQIYARQGKLEEALAQFIWVAQKQPNQPASFFNLTTIYYQLGQLNKAQEAMEQVARLDPTFSRLDDLRKMISDARNQSNSN